MGLSSHLSKKTVKENNRMYMRYQFGPKFAKSIYFYCAIC
ncbi:hypothetical protein PCIT_a3462 [Pseudoalteromonas citrea]|uniref:Uncharacterized protein n=1 Tax=Pseudoalteromonas citrea TaxID=43655 RepID=A0AAD4AGY1_9GAMM|nr:hypothetical protein PCIT_a3462 [Pseudoalteromonas citrea]